MIILEDLNRTKRFNRCLYKLIPNILEAEDSIYEVIDEIYTNPYSCVVEDGDFRSAFFTHKQTNKLFTIYFLIEENGDTILLDIEEYQG